MKTPPPFTRIEPLEARIAPATLVGTKVVTYTDVDGDAVTIKTTAGAFDLITQFDFVLAGAGEQLQGINLGADATFAGASITITAKAVPGGDGFVNVGAIRALVDLGKVTVNGDLGVIEAGDGGATQPALKALTVQSMGRFGVETQAGGAALVSTIDGTLPAFTVKTDLRDVEINVLGDLSKLTLGSLIGGMSDLSGRITTTGDVGTVKITRDVRGGVGSSSGTIEAGGAIKSLTILGSVIGGTGDNSARISSVTTMGKVSITGNLMGSQGIESGFLHAGGAIAGVTLGAMFGGVGMSSGSITSDTAIGTVKIKRGIDGGIGEHSGELVAGTTLGSVTLGASLTGAMGMFSGRIAAGTSAGAIKIGGDVVGGSSENSGVIQSDADIKSVTLGGSLIGGPAPFTGTLSAFGTLGPVKIGGDLLGGNAEFDGVAVERSGGIRAGRLPAITIGGSMLSGVNRSGTGTLDTSGTIVATDDIGTISIKGDLLGSASTNASITARGQSVLAVAATGDLAIKSVSIGGSVDRAVISVGAGLNADAQIGSLSVGGDWSRSSIAAGIDPVNGFFGGTNDLLIADADDRANIDSCIGSIIIKGQALGTADGTGEFGFVAEQIGSLKIGSAKFPLTSGDDVIPIGGSGDFFVREI
ncbi:MAG: hypothetical protein ABMA13_03425 [Chthoniobacteraceae bacterium]